MIVDDCYLVMGSANINDRSLLGSRDSELAVFIEGQPTKPVNTGYDTMYVVPKIHEFRRRIFFEHFGVDIEYPTSNENWTKMYGIAMTNTEVYNRAFMTYPSNEYANFQQLAGRKKELNAEYFMQNYKSITGHAVLYPYNFLKDAGLLENKNSELSMLAVPLYALY